MSTARAGGAGQVGLVLAGGGARGAYEAGAVAELLPELDRQGKRPRVVVGTSVGAINAAHVGASAHLPAERAAALGLERWRAISQAKVVRSILGWQAPATALRYAGQIAGVPGVRVPSLLDPAPLDRNLRTWIDWQALHENVAAGHCDAIVAVATSIASGRSVAFMETRLPSAELRSERVQYVRGQVDRDHVRASAAIPILFPPVRVETPAIARGWYMDGGTRLNTPIMPAIDLGADELVVVATDALGTDPHPVADGDQPPDFGDGAMHLLQGMLVDPLVQDLRMVGDVNALLAESEAPASAGSVLHFRASRGKHPYRPISCLLVAPSRTGAIGELAADVVRRRYRTRRSLAGLDIRVLDRLLGTDTETHGELLSYVLFDPEFIAELIAMGREDARAARDKWTLQPLPRGASSAPAGVAA